MVAMLGRKAATAKVIVPPRTRTSAHSRGYDNIWRNLSKRLRRQIGICERCQQQGKVRVCDQIDHIVPIADGGDRLARENLWALCTPCHEWKDGLENHARATDQIDRLPFWVRNPQHLPNKFRVLTP